MPTSTPVTPATASPTATPRPGEPVALHGGSLDPGTYTTTAFAPNLTFALGDGWRAPFQDDEDEIALEGPENVFLGITRVSNVVDPSTGESVPVPNDLVAWLSDIPGVTATKPKAIEVAGLSGKSFEVSLDENAQAIETFAYPTGNMRIPPGSHDRYIVIPLDGPDLTIIMGSESGPAAATEAVQPILDSLVIAPQ